MLATAVGPVRAAVPETFVVTTSADLAGAACAATCSLRQAINAANSNAPAHDLIWFAIPGGPTDITPGAALPAITDGVTIDGTTQPGMRLVGTSAGAGAEGMHVLASGTVIRGLEIRDFDAHGILLDGVHDTLIGGVTGLEGNVLAANGADGIAVIGDTTAINNRITANQIYGNGSMSIDLADDGQLGLVGHPIGGGPFGPNNLTPGPQIIGPLIGPVSEVTVDAGGVQVGVGRLDVFWSATCPRDSVSGFPVPQAEVFLGSVEGYSNTVFTLPAVQTTGFLTATSTHGWGTSEVGPCTPVNNPTDLAATAVVTPAGAIPVGSPIDIELTVTNLGPFVNLESIAGFGAPQGGATFTSISGSQGICETVDGGAACELVGLPSGGSVTIDIVVVPTAGGQLVLEGGVFDRSELDPNPGNNLFTLTIDVVADEDVGAVVSGGGSLTSDTELDGATPSDPIETTVRVPAGAGGGNVTISERPDPVPPPIGYGFVGQAVVITTAGDPASAAQPFVFEFLLDGSIDPGGTIVVFRNGVAVQPCTVANPLADPSATPDPCLLPRQSSGDDVRLTVRTSSASTWRVGYVLPYSFAGFFAPVDNGGVLNKVKAGAAVPVKFSLGGNRGLNIFAAGSPRSVGVPCGSASIDPVEETVNPGSSTLVYDFNSDRYQYVWKTAKEWAGTCRQLTIEFADGTTTTARFDFRR